VDHGHISGDTVRPWYGAAQQTFAALAAVGIDMHDVVEVLEVEAVDKFDTSSASLIASLRDAMAAATPGSTPTGTA
jgi:transaldolase